MHVFEKVSMIKNCSLEEMFDFHLDINNLKKITPCDTKVFLLNETFKASQGEVLKLKTVKNFIPTIWEVKIEKLQRPNLLLDIALKSPFKHWEHSHIFAKKGNICELRDVVKYQAPFGKIGEFFDFFIQRELTKMFNFRHKVTKEILCENQDKIK